MSEIEKHLGEFRAFAAKVAGSIPNRAENLDAPDYDNFLISHKQCFYVHSWQTQSIVYSRNTNNFFDAISKFEFKNIIEKIHKNDLEEVIVLSNKIFRKFASHKYLGQSSFDITFRLQQASGEFLHIHSHTINCENDANGNVCAGLSILTDISYLNLQKPVNWDLSVVGLSRDEILTELNAESLNEFTVRELEILSLLSKNLPSKVIADRLKISKNTVDTHRRNILHKTNSVSTKMLLEMYKKRGFF